MQNQERQKSSLKVPLIWALTDEITGHNAQVLGVIEALGMPFVKKKIVYNKSAKTPNFLKFDGLKTIDLKKSDNIQAPWPDVIISCGRKAASVALAIKNKAKKSGKKVFATHLMWPGVPFRGFDVIAIPNHDILPLIYKNSKNIIRTIGSPNRINKDFLLQEYRIWSRTIGEFPSPKVAVLLGGDSRKTKFTTAHAEQLEKLLVKLVSQTKSSLLATTSRRTSEEVSWFLKESLSQKLGRYFYFHEFGKSKANPFYALLQIADIIVVSGDSISMCSEAASSGKPVYIFSPEGNASEKHLRFHQDLYNSGFAEEFNESSVDKIIRIGVSKNETQSNQLSAAFSVANEILKRIS